MAKKDQISAMLAGSDGISVAQKGKDFQVAFLFSNTLVNRMRGVPGAVFDKDASVWNVPGSSAAELIATVADMRDFKQQGGVQVKDVEQGKLVVFDFDKHLAQEIGPVFGANFSKDAGGWIVAADSKALTAESGQVSYLDRTLNKMRGLLIEKNKAQEQIMEMAEEAAKARESKPGIHYPQQEHSYTGPIVAANGFYAAQLSGIDDGKGVAYLTIHEQADLGNAVLKGDDLRIDYGVGHDVKVRTTEVFRQQQAEREKFKELAAEKLEGATVLNASHKAGQQYSGKVVAVGDHFALQFSGREQFTIHDRSRLQGPVVANENMDVKYNDKGQGVVKEREKGREAVSR